MKFDASISLGVVIQVLTIVVIGIVLVIRRDDTLKQHELKLAEQEKTLDGERTERTRQMDIERQTIKTLAEQVQMLALSVQKLLTIVDEHQRRLDRDDRT